MTTTTTDTTNTCERCEGTGAIWRGVPGVSINDPCPCCITDEEDTMSELSIERTVNTGRDVPDGYTIGRCDREHGVAWPTGTLPLSDAVCPIHDGQRLYQTTRVLRRPFYLMTREAAKGQAAAAKAAQKAATAERIAAGATKLGRDIVPGDVVRVWSSIGRVIAVEQSPHVKARVRITFARLADDITDSKPWTVNSADLRKVKEYDLDYGDDHVWADENPGAAALYFLRQRIEQAERMVPYYQREFGRQIASGKHWAAESIARYQAEEAEARELVELLEEAAAAPAGQVKVSDDYYCHPCGRHHAPGAHVLTCRQCGETVNGLEIDAHQAGHDADPAIYPQPEPGNEESPYTAEEDAHWAETVSTHQAARQAEVDRHLAGLRTERNQLRGRTRAQYRPELEARLAKVEAEIAATEAAR